MNLIKVFNAIFPFRDFLYILQLEEYETKRYIKSAEMRFFDRNFEVRDRLVATKRVKITYLLSLLIFIFFSLFITPILSALLIPVWVGAANYLLDPYFIWIKMRLHAKAKKYFEKETEGTTVISVAGSYGKTTTKNYIYELVRFTHRTQMIPGNINTPTGIANWILKEFDPTSEVLIIEVDAYFIGEIGQSLTILPPDISILTNIGDQHLERLGTRRNLAKALFEAFVYAREDGLIITSKSVLKTLQQYKINYKKEKGKRKIKTVRNENNVSFAREAAKALNVPNDIITSTARELVPPDRRRSLIKIDDYEVIDDSYNISETTARAGIEYAQRLAKAHKQKIIVITAGIPELGLENRDGNKNLGKLLDKSAEWIILLKSILHEEVEKGIKNKEKIIYAASMKEALEKLTDFEPEDYLVLMQPELNDLYYID